MEKPLPVSTILPDWSSHGPPPGSHSSHTRPVYMIHQKVKVHGLITLNFVTSETDILKSILPLLGIQRQCFRCEAACRSCYLLCFACSCCRTGRLGDRAKDVSAPWPEWYRGRIGIEWNEQHGRVSRLLDAQAEEARINPRHLRCATARGRRPWIACSTFILRWQREA